MQSIRVKMFSALLSKLIFFVLFIRSMHYYRDLLRITEYINTFSGQPDLVPDSVVGIPAHSRRLEIDTP